jgi:hypothetical protein
MAEDLDEEQARMADGLDGGESRNHALRKPPRGGKCESAWV